MSAGNKSVLIVGLDPRVVDYSRWPGLSMEKLRAALDADEALLKEAGYEVRECLIDRGETAETTLREALDAHAHDCVMIGAGVRVDAENFLLFEKAINVVHRHAPGARICFNTGPSDTAAAVMRWL